MIALFLVVLPFIIEAAPVISAISGIVGLIADLEAIASSPETPIVLKDIEEMFKKHGVDPDFLAKAIKNLVPDGQGGWVTKEWASDKRHQLNPDGTFKY